MNKLFEILEKRDIKKKVFAEKIGITPQTLQNWKNGANSPTIAQARTMLDTLNENRTDVLFFIDIIDA